MAIMNTNTSSLYGFVLQQVAAESYCEDLTILNSETRIRETLELGTNRTGVIVVGVRLQFFPYAARRRCVQRSHASISRPRRGEALTSYAPKTHKATAGSMQGARLTPGGEIFLY
jgi:hypothetical protein